MLIIPPTKFRKHGGRTKPQRATQAPPARELILEAAAFDNDTVTVTLTFDRAIDIAGIVVGGDIIFSGVHFGVPAGDNRALWIKSLDQIGALNPAVIVPGHQVAGAPNDLSTIAFMKKYMEDWDASVAASKSADELIARMKKQYPALGLENLMNGGAQAAFRPAAR